MASKNAIRVNRFRKIKGHDVLKNNQERLEKRYYYEAKGYNYEWLINRVSAVLGVERNIITRKGRYPDTVEARSVLCFWGVRELGITTRELSNRLGVSQPTASQSVKRGEAIVIEKRLKLQL